MPKPMNERLFAAFSAPSQEAATPVGPNTLTPVGTPTGASLFVVDKRGA
jgi:hypothetical protein